MGSPVSPIVANLSMEEIPDTALNKSNMPPKKWCRYVDDVFSIIKRNMRWPIFTIYLIPSPHKLIEPQNRNLTENAHF
jgi:hypothetical protein